MIKNDIKNFIGKINYTRFGTKMKIVKYNNFHNIIVEFLDEHHIQKKTRYKDFTKGLVKNPYDRSVCNEGFLGEGAPTRDGDGVALKEYNVWLSMIKRCYSDLDYNTFVAYKDCVVSEEWKNYVNFYNWYNENKYICRDSLEVDKDILSKNEKIYSKETCLLIPREINRFCQASKTGGCYITPYGKWCSRVHHKNKRIHIGNFNTLEDGEREFLKTKNKIYQELVEKYREELPIDIYNKLKNAKLRG